FMDLDRTVVPADMRFPELAIFLILGADDLATEPDVVADSVSVGRVCKIAVQLVTLGKIMGPVVVAKKRVGIKMIGRIDAAARIGILVPDAADGIALFE